MAVHEKKESFKEHNDRGSILLAFYFVLTLLIPNLVLLYTEPYSNSIRRLSTSVSRQ